MQFDQLTNCGRPAGKVGLYACRQPACDPLRTARASKWIASACKKDTTFPRTGERFIAGLRNIPGSFRPDEGSSWPIDRLPSTFEAEVMHAARDPDRPIGNWGLLMLSLLRRAGAAGYPGRVGESRGFRDGHRAEGSERAGVVP